MLQEMLENLKQKTPLIHTLTNYVTANDCANILLACGASPIMADARQEVEEITSRCDGLCINLGTLSQRTIPAMLLAGKKANALAHPVLLDPVGAGSCTFRSQTAKRLLQEVQFTAIRGNVSEIKALALGTCAGRGVDAGRADAFGADTFKTTLALAKAFAQRSGALIAITGAVDLLTDGTTAFIMRGGHPMMSRVTGTGCMLSAMMTAYLAANPQNTLQGAAAAVCAMNLCGERAYKRLAPQEGSGSYRVYFIDEIYNLNGETLERGANYEVQERNLTPLRSD